MRSLLLIFFLYTSIASFSSDKKIVAYDTSSILSVKKVSAQKEKEIFSDKDFAYQKEAKASKGWWEAFLDWISKLLGKSFDKNPTISYNVVKYTFIFIFILGLIYILWKSKFRGLLKGDVTKLQGTSFADLPENIEGIHIDALIEKAISESNYRLAVRWCFLKSLQWLNSQNKITWQPSKTNIDYEQEIKDKVLREDFAKQSRVFEYVWYGETNPTLQFCIDYKNKVTNFINSVNV